MSRLIRSRSLSVITILALFALASCSSRDPVEPTATAGKSTISVVDYRGKTVEFAAPVEKIAFAVIPAPAMFVTVDGSWNKIVGINESTLKANKAGLFATMYPESLKTPVIANTEFLPNVETLTELNPDVVVQWTSRGPEITDPIENAGLPVVGMLYAGEDDLARWIETFGKLVAKEKRAQELIEWRKSKVEQNRQQAAKQTGRPARSLILSKVDDTFSAPVTDHTKFQFDLVGADLVSADITPKNPQVGPEQIIDWDPEVIFLSANDKSVPDDIYNDRRFANVSAVKNKRVYKTPTGGYRWQVSSMESSLMWAWMARLLNPGEPDGGFRTEMKETFKFLYNYDLSEEQIDDVLQPDIHKNSVDYDQFKQG